MKRLLLSAGLLAISQLSTPTIASAADCPEGYIPVGAVSGNFCVMKYEAKDAFGIPVSQPTLAPWVSINRDEAVAKCQELGPRYDLINNDQWQAIAQDAEKQSANWTGGAVGSGCLFNGNSNYKTCGYRGRQPDSGLNRNPRAKLVLSNGEEIWDLAGNVWEWVKDDSTAAYGSDLYISQVKDAAKEKFGTSGSDYSCDVKNGYCGFGIGWLNYSAGGILRGGFAQSEEAAGAFAVYLGFASTNQTSSMGFRCVYTAPTAAN